MTFTCRDVVKIAAILLFIWPAKTHRLLPSFAVPRALPKKLPLPARFICMHNATHCFPVALPYAKREKLINVFCTTATFFIRPYTTDAGNFARPAVTFGPAISALSSACNGILHTFLRDHRDCIGYFSTAYTEIPSAPHAGSACRSCIYRRSIFAASTHGQD